MQDFTVIHIDNGSIAVDHVQAESADAALEKAEEQGLTDPVVFAGHHQVRVGGFLAVCAAGEGPDKPGG